MCGLQGPKGELQRVLPDLVTVSQVRPAPWASSQTNCRSQGSCEHGTLENLAKKGVP